MPDRINSEQAKPCADRPPWRIVIVDDDRDTARMLERLLVGKGFEVHTAGNGTEALVVADACRPDAVLLDLGMPGLDGLHVGKSIRETMKNVFLIAVTGHTAESDRELTRAAGFDHHLGKPINLIELVNLLTARASGSDGK
jgi:DNA-binding response OmpR family regulator